MTTKPNIALIEGFAGTGTLTRALVDGLKRHCNVRVAGACEIEGKYLMQWSKAHPEGSLFHGSMTHYHPAEISIARRANEILVAVFGIPCTGTSNAGRSKNRLSAPEEHKDVGHLFLTTAHWIRAHMPDVLVFENVPGYPNTVSAHCLRLALRAAGYSMFERVVNAHTEFRTPTERIRWTMVATRRGFFIWNFVAEAFDGTLGDFLDAPSERDEEESFSADRVAAMNAYIARKQSEGCGFAMRLIGPETRRCPTLCSSYGKVQPSATFVRSKTSFRMIRPREMARIHGFPDDFELPETKTTAYEVLGQGVCYRPFFALGEAVGEFIAQGVESFQLAA